MSIGPSCSGGLAGFAPFGTMPDNPVSQRALKSNVATGFLGFNPLVPENFLAFRLKLTVKRRVLSKSLPDGPALCRQTYAKLDSQQFCNIPCANATLFQIPLIRATICSVGQLDSTHWVYSRFHVLYCRSRCHPARSTQLLPHLIGDATERPEPAAEFGGRDDDRHAFVASLADFRENRHFSQKCHILSGGLRVTAAVAEDLHPLAGWAW